MGWLHGNHPTPSISSHGTMEASNQADTCGEGRRPPPVWIWGRGIGAARDGVARGGASHQDAGGDSRPLCCFARFCIDESTEITLTSAIPISRCISTTVSR